MTLEEGKWYVCTQTYTLRGKIVVIKGQTYKSNQDGAIEGEDGHLFIDKIDGKALNYFKPWTIQDAKEGDVLACNEEILLFKSYSVQGRISLYCWYNGQTNNFHSKEVTDTLLTTRNKICPATKEQRDQLEKAMNDAGYTFDFEKKELKKIEQKPAGNKGMNLVEEEMTPFQKKVFCIIDTTIEEEQGLKQVCDELFALASNEIKQESAEWSEEDEAHIDSLLKRLVAIRKPGAAFIPTGFTISEDADWLKSLRHQKQWKPSDEQIIALRWVLNNIPYNKHKEEISGLLDQIKEL